ncbi:hypothetical protein [Leptolyngbya sp. FACHB-711]|uniref:P-II family nitrogen regulator n=1 Tax=unclassified Leptolyngbya TaxID=2650499 RepID=UPI001689E5FB|nr:hypothetical protein [Leptolyngbya sp. FACHB-711]MBD1850951.1 hypothetical protein [Cyanobacteria bacterium FACHB-502]MBD2024253.1 hypothetical protein [Leptolyngbya sp. FACHB-711]
MLDFEQASSLTESAVLVTIITEAVLQESIVSLLKSLKVIGYSITQVEGGGRYTRLHHTAITPPENSEAGGSSLSDGTEAQVETQIKPNIEIRAIVNDELSNVILYALKEQQRNFAIVAYRQAIEVLAEN